MKIFFAWETGAGMGHLLPHRKLLIALKERGHEIHVAGRETSRVGKAFGGLGFKIWQAPAATEPPDRMLKPTFTMGHVLHNSGFENEDALAARCAAWDSILEAIQPDVVIAEYAPTLLLAARGSGIKLVALGNGFGCPPAGDHFPVFSTLAHGAPPGTLESDGPLLQRMNRLLETRGRPLLKTAPDLYNDDVLVLLLSLPELDHYEERRDGHYMGSAEPPPGGQSPSWPSGTGPKLFGYLKPCGGIETVLNHLLKLRTPTIVVGDGLNAGLRQRFSQGSLVVTDQRVNIAETAASADVAMTNANIGTCSDFLLRGVPLLNLPLTLEQRIVSKRMTDCGAAESINPDTGKATTIALKKLAGDPKYKSAARNFAQRNKEFLEHSYEDRCLKKLQEYAGL